MLAAALGLSCRFPCGAGDALQPGMRGVATKAPAGMKIDGDLSRLPRHVRDTVEYFHDDLRKPRHAVRVHAK